MFSFFFKRSSKNVPTPAARENIGQDMQNLHAEQKASALDQAKKLESERDAVEFILKCSLADARLQAAQHIQSRACLEEVLQGIRNTDRRVARLMQQRLEALAKKEKTESEAKILVGKAQALIEQGFLLPNHLSEIDLAWKKLVEVPESLAQEFESSRSVLQEKLNRQTELQRSVIETRNRIRRLKETISLQKPADLESGIQLLEKLKSEIGIHEQASEVESLPKNLLEDLSRELKQAEHMLQKEQQKIKAVAAYEEVYTKWESEPVENLDINTIKRLKEALPELDEVDKTVFEQRLKHLLNCISSAKQAIRKEPLPLPNVDLLNALSQLEKALEEGSLQTAIEQEKLLKSTDLKAAGWSNAQISRFAKARNELLRLQGWAKWGGTVSREELIKSAEALSKHEILPAELAKKVGGLRSLWKSMDVTSGPSSKELWLRFDAACSLAYAPAAEHFQRLAEERKHNLEKARTIIAEIESFAAQECSLQGSMQGDWKRIVAYRGKMLQSWHELGPIDRKEKKQVDAKFAEVMQLLSAPLANQQKLEINRREEMIAEVGMLDPADRLSLDSIRIIQQRWQDHAKAFPLERKDEQNLWQKFRASCDQFFDQRKKFTQQAESVQQHNLQLKQRICEELESSLDFSEDAIKTLLHESAEQWEKIGRVPRTSGRSVQIRYQDAIAALNNRLAEKQRQVRREQFSVICLKLAVCRTAERCVIKSALTKNETEINRLQSEWEKIPPLPREWESRLVRRFEAVMAAIQKGSTDYASMLQANRRMLERNLLLLEILLEADSPAALSGERLKLQVEVLQSALKSGTTQPTASDVLFSILETPAESDEASDKRTDGLICKMTDQVT
jgi:hypothetical protein